MPSPQKKMPSSTVRARRAATTTRRQSCDLTKLIIKIFPRLYYSPPLPNQNHNLHQGEEGSEKRITMCLSSACPLYLKIVGSGVREGYELETD